MDLPVNPPLDPMLAKAAKVVPGEGYSHEPKWDGFRALIFRDGEEVFIGSRSGKDLGRYFPEVVAAARAELPERCVLDGEIAVAVHREGRKRLDWESLSARIHPAESRINRLAEETPAIFIGFDAIATADVDLTGKPFSARREVLEAAYAGTGTCRISRVTTDADAAQDWFERFEGAGLDGVISKRIDGHYLPGKREMIKVKHARTAEAVVIGYRPHKSQPNAVGSMLLGLYQADGELWPIGGIGAFTAAKREEYLQLLEPMRTADSVQGEPNRWATPEKTGEWVPVRPELVVEFDYDQMEGMRLRHTAKFKRWRPDRTPESCGYDQLEVPVNYDLDDVLQEGR
ncbi:ATP-dependent DNA ligase [Tsukamurella sp. PLM1]|uniref:ATP-dependent DNA ligase n=1 Tax=Tsukamurella sp. PLM1 TaxID=2929795 RepID=UPI0020607093|nr:ATP-dependent DNA ligase [Tsukamurella sp. PLM1]BDH59605.1 DNA ligase C1 [Tsukamurella sp. PLM1]